MVHQFFFLFNIIDFCEVSSPIYLLLLLPNVEGTPILLGFPDQGEIYK